MFIGCTKKLADTMKIKVNDETLSSFDPFYAWHANLFMFAGRKGVILMNNATRYCIVLYGLRVEHFKKFDQIVLSAIEETFLAEGFSQDKVDKYREVCSGVKFIKTHDRSILSQMNEFLISITWKIEKYLPSESLNIIQLNRWAGKLICCSLGGVYPIDLLKIELEKL